MSDLLAAPAATLALTVPLFLAAYAAGRAAPTSRGFALGAAVLFGVSALNALHYTHLFDALPLYAEYRSHRWADFMPALSGVALGYHLHRQKHHAAAKRIMAAVTAAALMLLPWAKPLLSPVNHADMCERRHAGGAIGQSTPSTCGPASLANILESLGRAGSESAIALACHSSRSGTESWYLARHARSLGLRAVFYQGDAMPPTPAIIGIRMGSAGHFIALLRVTDTELHLVDSLRGRFTLPKSDWEKLQPTGFALVITEP